MNLIYGDKAMIKEGQHVFKVGTVVEFREMEVIEGESVYVFEDERGFNQYLTKEEFEYIGRR